METVFSQLELQATRKLKKYIRSDPHTLAVMKIVIQESRFSSPLALSCIAAKYIDTNVLRNEEWRPEQTDSNAFKVVHDGFTWINLTSVNITVWMREGEAPIDIEVNKPGHLGTTYATGVSIPLLNCSRTLN